jgi:L-aminopeptidase/D-esterase-like protein
VSLSVPATPRARDLGIPFDGTPGAHNAITDVPGTEVGHVTLVSGDGPLESGRGPVRTGVSAVLPLGRAGIGTSCPAGWYSLNGNGEMTGTHWITESGGLSTPVMMTNTAAVGSVHRGVVEWAAEHRPDLMAAWLLPVVAETWDGYLNDIGGRHVTEELAGAAIERATGGPVGEGSVGGGTGMVCYGFKGGVGTSSRRVGLGSHEHVVGAYVQANFGDRRDLRIAGMSLGDLDVANPVDDPQWWERDLARLGVRPRTTGGGGALHSTAGAPPSGAGSVIVLIATDAPLLPIQCTALARRVPLGLARTGTIGGHFSGDLFLAWSTSGASQLDSGFPAGEPGPDPYRTLRFVPWERIDGFYEAVVQAVEEAVVNALIVNRDMVGRDANWVPALPHDLVVDRLGLARG